MRSKKQLKNKKGIAIFLVLFLMIVLGTLMIQYFHSSRQAQNSAYRFLTSEMARQIAASGQEEAYKYLYDRTGQVYRDENNTNLNDIPAKIIQRSSEIDLSNVGLDNRSSVKGINLEIPATKEMAEAIMPDRMDITATARIVDFRNQSNTDNGMFQFYGNEGIGTIEIAVTVKPKESQKKKYPASCTLIRHYDYKVVSILSNQDNRESSYVGNSYLDYVLFIRNGQNEFKDSDGKNLNANNVSLEINAEDGSALGQVNLGTSKPNYTYLNISEKTKDFIPNVDQELQISELDANDDIVNKILPKFKDKVDKDAKNRVPAGKTYKSHTVDGHEAKFYQLKKPITDDAINTNELVEARDNAAKIAAQADKKTIPFENGDKPAFYAGITINPKEKLSEIIKTDVRKQYFNYGYFRLNLDNCKVKIDVEDEEGNPDTIGPNQVTEIGNYSEFTDKQYVCYKSEPSSPQENVNQQELEKYINSKGDETASKAFTSINDNFAYLPQDQSPNAEYNQMFYKLTNGTSQPVTEPEQAQYPYAHFSLFSKRYLEGNELESFGIYDKANNKLYLRGIIHHPAPIVLGNSSSDLEVIGNGVIISNEISIEGGIKKKNPKDVCVIFARNGKLKINTSKTIEAVLMAMGQDIKNSTIICNDALDLKGALITDLLSLTEWKQGVTHKISYDEALNPVKDIYQIDISKRVTFERVVENE